MLPGRKPQVKTNLISFFTSNDKTVLFSYFPFLFVSTSLTTTFTSQPPLNKTNNTKLQTPFNKTVTSFQENTLDSVSSFGILSSLYNSTLTSKSITTFLINCFAFICYIIFYLQPKCSIS